MTTIDLGSQFLTEDYLRLGIGNLGIKDLARAKQSLEKRQRVLKMTVRAGRL